MNCNLTHMNGNRQFFIPMIKPVNFNPKQIELDPYLLGVLLGDGGLTKSAIRLSSADPEIIEQVRKCLPSGVFLDQFSDYDFQFTTRMKGCKSNPITNAIRKLGLLGHHSWEKFIPKEYLYNSVHVRTEILQGLLDTDGSITDHSSTSIEYSSTSEQLVADIVELVQSLGGNARVKSRISKYDYKDRKSTRLNSSH